jgi:hypothetical protein
LKRTGKNLVLAMNGKRAGMINISSSFLPLSLLSRFCLVIAIPSLLLGLLGTACLRSARFARFARSRARAPQRVPRCFLETPPRRAKTLPRRPKALQGAPQDVPKTLPRRPQVAPRRSKTHPRRPKTPQDPPQKGSKTPPKTPPATQKTMKFLCFSDIDIKLECCESLAPSEASQRIFRASRRHPGPSWERRGAILGRLGAILERLGAILASIKASQAFKKTLEFICFSNIFVNFRIFAS